jgi:hypothetical protein
MNMKAEPHLEQSMQQEQIRKALIARWQASAPACRRELVQGIA